MLKIKIEEDDSHDSDSTVFRDDEFELPELEFDPTFEEGELLPDVVKNNEVLINFCDENYIVKFGDSDRMLHIKNSFMDIIKTSEFPRFAQESDLQLIVFEFYHPTFQKWVRAKDDDVIKNGQELRAAVKCREQNEENLSENMQLELYNVLKSSEEKQLSESDNSSNKHTHKRKHKHKSKSRERKNRKKHRTVAIRKHRKRHRSSSSSDRRKSSRDREQKKRRRRYSSSSDSSQERGKQSRISSKAVCYKTFENSTGEIEYQYEKIEYWQEEECGENEDKWQQAGPSKGEIYSAYLNIKGKHPVMGLSELCSRMEWHCPQFKLVQEKGEPHSKLFQMQVKVKGETYVTEDLYRTKKEAKAEVAQLCLQKLGYL